MTLKYFVTNLITGTSADRTGGTWTNLPAGYRFIETDTLFTYYWDGTTWNTLLATTSGGSVSVVYDSFPAVYDITTDASPGSYASCNTLVPTGLYRVAYRGYKPSNVNERGQDGVRVPSTLPPDSSPRVFYGYPYTTTETGTGSISTLTLTEGPYYTDIDVTFYMRTKSQLKTTNVKIWEVGWFFWHFNQAGFQLTQLGAHFHHYYVLLKTDGHIELGKKDRDDMVDAQRFFTGAGGAQPSFTFAFNQWYKVRIRHVGNHIEMWLDDVKKVDVYDNGTISDGAGVIPAASNTIGSGRFGMYAEDSQCEWSPMTLQTIGTGTTSAPSSTPYLTLGTDGTLTGERVLALGSTKLSKTDGGAGGNLTLDAVEANFTLGNIGGTLGVTKGGTGQATAIDAFNAISPSTTLGDIIHNDGTNDVRLAGNTTLVKQFLSQTGNGTISAAPAWVTPKSVGVWYLAALAHAAQTIIYVTAIPVLSNATESIMDLIFDYTFTVKRFRLSVQANTKSGNTVFSFRDDAADVTGATITVAAGATGEYDSGALSVDVVTGSKINWKIDATASVSGSITFYGFVEYEIALQ